MLWHSTLRFVLSTHHLPFGSSHWNHFFLNNHADLRYLIGNYLFFPLIVKNRFLNFWIVEWINLHRLGYFMSPNHLLKLRLWVYFEAIECLLQIERRGSPVSQRRVSFFYFMIRGILYRRNIARVGGNMGISQNLFRLIFLI